MSVFLAGRNDGHPYQIGGALPLKKQPYGDWEFEVRDPNGYVLVFGGD